MEDQCHHMGLPFCQLPLLRAPLLGHLLERSHGVLPTQHHVAPSSRVKGQENNLTDRSDRRTGPEVIHPFLDQGTVQLPGLPILQGEVELDAVQRHLAVPAAQGTACFWAQVIGHQCRGIPASPTPPPRWATGRASSPASLLSKALLLSLVGLLLSRWWSHVQSASGRGLCGWHG